MIISSDISFKEITHMKKRKLLFWGAGKKFDIFQNGSHEFLVPDNYDKGTIRLGKNGHKYVKMGNIAWYTNLDVQKRHTTKVVLDTKVDIVTWDDIQIENDENIVIILTLKNHQEVINQLKACCRDENIYILTYEECRKVIDNMKFGDSSSLFGNEKDESFKGSIGTIYQSFAGEDLYPILEEKAANLLYFVTKNHSFFDGNKRIAVGKPIYDFYAVKVL